MTGKKDEIEGPTPETPAHEELKAAENTPRPDFSGKIFELRSEVFSTEDPQKGDRELTPFHRMLYSIPIFLLFWLFFWFYWRHK